MQTIHQLYAVCVWPRFLWTWTDSICALCVRCTVMYIVHWNIGSLCMTIFNVCISFCKCCQVYSARFSFSSLFCDQETWLECVYIYRWPTRIESKHIRKSKTVNDEKDVGFPKISSFFIVFSFFYYMCCLATFAYCAKSHKTFSLLHFNLKPFVRNGHFM